MVRAGGSRFNRRFGLIIPGQVVFIPKEVVRRRQEKILLAVLLLPRNPCRARPSVQGRVHTKDSCA